ncbi:hypothetical protein EV702DRAFT_1081437 [Suillus placidus]|uniref:Uncharacterized protein n=1 Tax=Suillus placidus TaxID=48579 RepID=A0A9P7D5U0_9AGAM|nr:hypothetical protein EV702DRAFT_1081437 [Suillus placidus]
MAHLIRSAKTASEWVHRDLVAYNINIVTQSKQQFFHTALLRQPDHPSLDGFMSTWLRQNAADNETAKLLHYLELVDESGGHEAAIDNFLAKLLEKLEYDDDNRIIFVSHDFPFDICGETSSAEINICIVGENQHTIMLVLDKKLKDPEPQVIAAAIAAYANDNEIRTMRHRPRLPTITFPAITMHGTYPIFYKITVTAQLCDAVAFGTYPPTTTHALRYIPDLPLPYNEGMHLLQNRIEILTCLEAFKQFLQN